MHTLRHAHLLARCVLLWFALSIGVAIASPLVHPQDLQFVCSAAGSLKLSSGGNGGQSSSGPTLDCPLCAGLAAPPPLEIVAFTAAAPLQHAAAAHASTAFMPVLAVPPPARGPPAALL